LDSLRGLRPRLEPAQELARDLGALLDPVEADALRVRLAAMLEHPAFPWLDPRINVPWPFL
ncbi:MAG: hypothetical protein FJ313_05215, partial [Gemmatimonadetes bacterium]|nr:hypothetical protein [Gemmatimonadota bacterium]